MSPDIYKSDQGQRLVEDAYRALLARWSSPNRKFHVPTRFGHTHIISCGVRGHLPPLVLFHGSGSNSAMWLGDMAIWASNREIYAIDMIGEPGLSAAVAAGRLGREKGTPDSLGWKLHRRGTPGLYGFHGPGAKVIQAANATVTNFQ